MPQQNVNLFQRLPGTADPNRHKKRESTMARISLCWWFAAPACLIAGATHAQVPSNVDGRTSYVGEVIGDDVFVRSGPGLNYYHVTKLKAGARVRVVGSSPGWLVIEPPKGCFSLIHKKFVDVGPDKREGVVNANAVLVRAGSELSSQLYAKQTKLNRGAAVHVILPHNDDYLRIEPPAGAFLYISDQFVRRLPPGKSLTGGPASSLAPRPTGSTDGGTRAVPANAVGDGVASLTGTQPSAGAGVVAGAGDGSTLEVAELRADLKAIEDDLKAEDKKPLLHRDYATIKARYRKLIDQDVDEYSKRYSEARIAQLSEAEATIAMVQEVHQMGEELTADRKRALQVRGRIQPVAPVIGGGFDVVGELRKSLIYSSPVGPRRYRLVGADGVRTLGYVEIAPGAVFDVDRFLGRRVGVRAIEKKLQTEDVDPLLIYVVSELVTLDAKANEPVGDTGSVDRD
jgi:hypothetical protein